MAPGETKAIDLERPARSLGSLQNLAAGLEFEYTTKPGSVIISAQSVSTDDNQVYRVSVIDAQAQMSSTGKYPWNLNGGSSTVVYIKNVTDEQQSYYLYANYSGGFWIQGVKTIEPHQTVALDLRRVKEEQTRDEKDHTLPDNAMEGQVFWSGAGTKNLVLIGRVEQVEAGGGMSFTTACGTCCFPHFSYGVITPVDQTVEVGASTQFQFNAKEQSADCYGVPYASETPASGYVVWSSSDTSVATINSSGVATTYSAGTTFISAHWQANNWEYVDHTPCDPETGICGGFQGGGQPMGSCDYQPLTAEPQTTYSAKPRVTSTSPNKGLIGQPINVTITGVGFVFGSTVAVGGGVVQNVTIQSSTTITANYTSNDDASGGNHGVTVTSNGQTSTNNVNFYIQIPTSLQVLSVTTLPTGTTGDYGLYARSGLRYRGVGPLSSIGPRWESDFECGHGTARE